MAAEISIREDVYGEINGEPITRFTLRNTNSMEISLINYGAHLIAVRVPDRHGQLEDVVLGYDALRGYMDDSQSIGCTVGRVAGRIANGRMTIDGKEYKLPSNPDGNHLHGGPNGFGKRVWTASTNQREGTVTFAYASRDGEVGYPGDLVCSVAYTLTNENAIRLEYRAMTTKACPVNLTNHSYFNLAGHAAGADALFEHVVSIAASSYTPLGADWIPTGEVAPVAGTLYDLRVAKRLGDVIPKLSASNGFDGNFCVGGPDGQVRPVAKVVHPASGRVMVTHSNAPGLVFYTSNMLPTTKGKHDAIYGKHAALCLETQLYPDSVNHSNFPDSVLRPGQVYSQSTVYTFSTE